MPVFKGNLKKVFTKALEQPDNYDNTHRHAVQVEIDGKDVWIGLPPNKMDALMVEEEGKWKVVGEGSNVKITYTENKGYLNAKKADFLVIDLVEGKKFETKPAPAQAPTASKAPAPAEGKKWVDNTVGMAVGAACNNAISLLNAGTIQEEDFAQAALACYTFSEAFKRVVSEGTPEAILSHSFSLKGSPTAPQSLTEHNSDMPSDDDSDGIPF